MKPQPNHWNVSAPCPDCGGAVTTYEHRDSSREFSHTWVRDESTETGGKQLVAFKLLRCSVCSGGALAKFLVDSNPRPLELLSFLPRSIASLDVPDAVPDGVRKEFREAETCASALAWRAASALLRSTLEKTLKANGYDAKGTTLEKRIDAAAADGVITEARRRRAHDDVRVLGNDVLHDEWREVTEDEYDAAHHYVQRILEDLYDDRPSVEGILLAKGRIKSAPQQQQP